METNKKKLYQSLGVFLFFAFVPVYVPSIVLLVKDVPYLVETTLADGTVESGLNPIVNLLLTAAMLCPAIAMLLTRSICKEGFSFYGEGSMLLGMEFQKKKWLWYLVALIAPSIYTEATVGTMLVLHPECFSTEMAEKLGITAAVLFCYPFMGMLHAVIASVGALGEEAGWRGYMMPKLEKLFGNTAAVIIGGIIWGIWHYPALLLGHNFGHGYMGEPWSGFLVFTAFTVIANAFFHITVKKTGSIWPAVFFHAANNGVYSVTKLYFDMEKVKGISSENLNLCIMILESVYMLVLFLLVKRCHHAET